VNEFEPPRDDRQAAVDPDVDDAAIQRALSAAKPIALGLFAVGLVHLGNLLQIVLFAYWQSVFVVIGELCALTCAIAFIAVGSKVYDASYPAAIAGVFVGFGAAFVTFVWFVVLLLQGTITPLPLIAAGASALCGIACGVLVPFAAKAAAARRRLFE